MKAAVGRIVRVLGVVSNGTDEQCAIITRAHSAQDTKDGAVYVNLTVFPDCGDQERYSSVALHETREEAAAAARATSSAVVAFWPERV